MSHCSVKYGQTSRFPLSPFIRISLKNKKLNCPALSPWARRGPTRGCLMIVGSCIKYTQQLQARWENTYSLGSGAGGSPIAACKEAPVFGHGHGRV